jgi:hypothetical protein
VGQPGRGIHPVSSAQALAHAHAEHPTRRPAVTSDSDQPVVQIGYLRAGCGSASVTDRSELSQGYRKRIADSVLEICQKQPSCTAPISAIPGRRLIPGLGMAGNGELASLRNSALTR